MGYSLKSAYRFPYCVTRTYSRPSHYYYLFKHCYQRIKRGYSFADLWSMDEYLAKILIDALPHYKNTNHPYVSYTLPEDSPGLVDYRTDEEIKVAEERWDAMIDEIITGLEQVYGEDPANPYSEKSHEASQKAMRLFAENFGTFWD